MVKLLNVIHENRQFFSDYNTTLRISVNLFMLKYPFNDLLFFQTNGFMIKRADFIANLFTFTLSNIIIRIVFY